jgi:hypothetical protein
MIVFCSVDNYSKDDVVLPDGIISLHPVYSDELGKYFLCMELIRSHRDTFYRILGSRYILRPTLGNYKALSFKRQPYFEDLDFGSLNSFMKYSSLPISSDYVGLSDMRNLYSKCKRYYVAVVDRSISGEGNREEAVIVFDRYSDAIDLMRMRPRKILELVGSGFVLQNRWYPYLWVEYMNHPVCLLGEIRSHAGIYSLGSTWCYYLVCFLRDSSVKFTYMSSVFGFVFSDRFSKIVYYRDR